MHSLLLKTLLLHNFVRIQVQRREPAAPQRARVDAAHTFGTVQPQRGPMPEHDFVAQIPPVRRIKPCVLPERNVGIRGAVFVVQAAVCVERAHSGQHVGDIAQAVLAA